MLYAIEAVGLDRIKLGYSKDDAALSKRFEALQVGCPVPAVLLGVLPEATMADEKAYHRYLGWWRVRGEWFVKAFAWPLIAGLFVTWEGARCARCEAVLPLSAAANTRRRRIAKPVCAKCHTVARKTYACVKCGAGVTESSAHHQRARIEGGEADVGCRTCTDKAARREQCRRDLGTNGVDASLKARGLVRKTGIENAELHPHWNSARGVQTTGWPISVAMPIGDGDSRTRTEAP